jgi:23S rRNA pseudouridine1911/1915/1917 synthase
MTGTTDISLLVPNELGGTRLDLVLQKLLPEHSRTRLQTWIKENLVTVDGQPSTAKTKVWGGETVIVSVQPRPETLAFTPENIPLNIIYEDEDVLVINKPAGMVVHPAVGNWSGTLLNALLFHLPSLNDVPRAGIVHRLDKETSGLLVVAKNIAAQTHLVRQLQARTVKREYRAIVWGQLWRNGIIKQPIGRDAKSRTKMAISRTYGKMAITHYEVLERFSVHTYLRCNLETGRTHQIRVHMQHIKAPLVGDPIYGYRNILPIREMTQHLRETVSEFKRQALHAIKLGFIHPTSNEFVEWQIDLADDMKVLLESMRYEEPVDEDAEHFDFGVDENGLYIGDDEDEEWDDESEEELEDDFDLPDSLEEES